MTRTATPDSADIPRLSIVVRRTARRAARVVFAGRFN